jgi:hypothetical protein
VLKNFTLTSKPFKYSGNFSCIQIYEGFSKDPTFEGIVSSTSASESEKKLSLYSVDAITCRSVAVRQEAYLIAAGETYQNSTMISTLSINR